MPRLEILHKNLLPQRFKPNSTNLFSNLFHETLVGHILAQQEQTKQLCAADVTTQSKY